MEFRQFLINKLILFFMLTTCITIATVCLGLLFDADAQFGYEAMLSPMRLAACCVAATFVTYSRRELKRKEMLVRILIQLVLMEAVILTAAYRSPVIDTDRLAVVVSLAASVLVIYVLVFAFNWLKGTAEAGRMNADLAAFQKNHEQ